MNFPSVSNFSIAKGTSATNPPEMYIPLWWYSGADTGGSNTTIELVQKGATSLVATTSTSSAVKLHTLNPNWSPSQKFAFEAAIVGGACNAELYDITTGTAVTASQISTTNTGNSNVTIVRSSQFTLTPGHVYGVGTWTSNSGYGAILINASLIVFPQ